MEQKYQDILNSKEFKGLVKRRALFCITGAILIAIVYFGFLIFIALYKKPAAVTPDNSLTINIPLGVGLILLSWLTTGVYLYWANHKYDVEVDKIKNKLKNM